MTLRCLLFSADEGTAEVVSQALTSMGAEGEHCAEGADALEKAATEAFQIVIIDWDLQPEAGVVLKTSRERRPAERPLTLAIVSDDIDVPKALRAGTNSILRRPILVNQLKDTLSTARDLLRARLEPAPSQTSGSGFSASASAVHSALPVSVPASRIAGNERTLRAGEFLQSASAPGGQFVTETDLPDSSDQSMAGPVDLLKDLEPMAAAMAEVSPKEESPAPEQPDAPRGLEWYLKRKAGTGPQASAQRATVAAAAAPAPAKEELLGYEQTVSYSAQSASAQSASARPVSARPVSAQGVSSATAQPSPDPPSSGGEEHASSDASADEQGHVERARSGARIGRGAITMAVVLACIAVLLAPQAPWHANVLTLWARGQRGLHVWLNPQPVAPAQAPPSHENFGRAGDEYKLPVAENIPDATTDPSQIKVMPVIDPTVKQPNNTSATAAAQTAADNDAAAPADETPNADSQLPGNPLPGSATENNAAEPPKDTPKNNATAAVPAANSAIVPPPMPPPVQPHPASTTVSNPAVGSVPSSLRSQMASMTPDASGNKPADAAMPAIEPVAVPELAERGLLADQPAIGYPATGKGQQGTVVLQVLVGRDGTVQDAKFLQGSFAFARAAIDGVKQWKFKPYQMNGRAVSVQTSMTVSFKPGS